MDNFKINATTLSAKVGELEDQIAILNRLVSELGNTSAEATKAIGSESTLCKPVTDQIDKKIEEIKQNAQALTSLTEAVNSAKQKLSTVEENTIAAINAAFSSGNN